MNRTLVVTVAALALAGCRDRRAGGERTTEPPAPAPTTPAEEPAADVTACTEIEYAVDIAVPEASGAAWFPDRDALLVVSDSGNGGLYVEVDAAGAIVRRGVLPLGAAGEDVEGLARDGARLWGLTSGGWMRAWERDGDRFRLAVDAFEPEAGADCGPASVNCGRNYEGLCLAPSTLADGCDGYAASKTDGHLYCLRRDGADRFRLDASRAHRVTNGGLLADCAIAGDGTVWTGDNGFGLNTVRQWQIDAGGATLVGSVMLGPGNAEVLAFGPAGALYRFSDLSGSPSLTRAFRCPARLPKAGPSSPPG